MAEAIEALLIDCGKPDASPPPEVRAIDEALAPHAADLKGLLKALRLCSCAIGLLRLHLLCEQTPSLLCAAPAKGVATYLEEALCADIDKCASPQCLSATAELMNFMLAQNNSSASSQAMSCRRRTKSRCAQRSIVRRRSSRTLKRRFESSSSRRSRKRV